MHADFDLSDDGELVDNEGFTFDPTKNIGGRPKGYSPKKARAVQARIEAGEDVADDVDPMSDEGKLSTSVKTALAKARKEVALAGLNELALSIKSGEYLPRGAYREATATVLAALSQGLRSLPDTLERRVNLSPEALEIIERTIDDSLNQVAETLALFAGAE